MNLKIPFFPLSALAILVLFSSCIKDKFEDLNVTYNGTLAFPVASVGFTVEEALEGDSLYVLGEENPVRLIYRDDNFYTLSAAEYLDDITGDFEDAQTESFQIGNVAIDDVFVEAPVSFENIVDDFEDEALKQFFIQNNGSSLEIPAFTEDIKDDVNVPTLAGFTTLDIETGTLRISVTNNLFFDVQNLSATIIDEVNMVTIGTVNFDFIPVGGMASSEIDLAGKSITNNFRFELGNLESPGTGGVPVTLDLQASLLTSLEIFDVVIKAGVVELPADTYLTEEYLFELEFDGDERIYKMELENAALDYAFTSDVKADFVLRLFFQDIIRDGSPVSHEIAIGATNGGTIEGTLDLGNCTWRLDQDPAQAYNRMRIGYEVVLENPTGTDVVFSADDEVNFELIIKDLAPALVEGYLGKKEELIDMGQIDLGVDFSIFEAGSSPIIFDNPTIRVEVNNSFGVPLNMEFDGTAYGEFGGQAQINPPNPLVILHPGIVGQSVTTNLIFDKNNSGIVDVLSVYPTTLNYSGKAIANPEDNPQTVNFVTSESELTASTELELPFTFSVDNLIYEESGESIDLDLEDGLTIDDIDSAVIKISYHNQLPLNSSFTLSTIGVDGTEAPLVSGVMINAATANATGRVDEDGITHAEVFVRLSREQILQLDEAIENIYTINFMTPENTTAPVSIYSDYSVDLNIGMTVTFDK